MAFVEPDGTENEGPRRTNPCRRPPPFPVIFAARKLMPPRPSGAPPTPTRVHHCDDADHIARTRTRPLDEFKAASRADPSVWVGKLATLGTALLHCRPRNRQGLLKRRAVRLATPEDVVA